MIAASRTYLPASSAFSPVAVTPWAVSGQDYGYDANGNLEYDRHRRITSIDYNAIDRPRQIRFEQGDTISYIYSSAGERLAEILPLRLWFRLCKSGKRAYFEKGGY